MGKEDLITEYLEQQRRPQWNRNKSFGAPQTSKSNPPLKPLQDKPPIPVSSATKNKLSVFQFGGQVSDSKTESNVISLLSDDEKENANSTENLGGQIARRMDMIDIDGLHVEKRDKVEIIKKRDTIDVDMTDVAGQPVITPDKSNPDCHSVVDERGEVLKASEGMTSDKIKNNFPSTPAARLELPDLIGMEDVHRFVQDISPEDRIEWDRRSSSSSIGTRKIKRRRARSSSPISSPSHPNPHHRELQVDPGSELWGRYSLDQSTIVPPEGSKAPVLARLMQTSSPQPTSTSTTPRSPRSAVGFRRTNSCGTQFPKRRRLKGSHGDDSDVFTETASVGPSHLSVFIERVQEGLVLPAQSENGSSPTDKSMLSSSTQDTKSPGKVNYTTPSPNQSRSGDSDYGDFDDVDMDESTLLSGLTTVSEYPVASTTNLSQHGLNAIPETSQPPTIVVSEPPGPQNVPANEDEFDDFDDELFAADLEGIVAQFDNGQAVELAPPISRAEKSKPQATVLGETESDDEFGDGGLDDLDFEKAEASATQSFRQALTSIPVRTRYP